MKIPSMIRYTLGVILLYLAITFLITSCKSTAVTASKPVKDPYQTGANSLLWEISGNGLTESSYLFGTIHIIGSNDFFWPTGSRESLAKTERLVLEVNMDDLGDAMQIMQKSKMKDGQTLENLLGKKKYDKLNSFMTEKVGMGISMFNSFQPMLLMSLPMSKMIDGETVVYEQEFTKLAKDSDMEIDALESIDFQISIFSKIPYEAQADMLMQYVDDFEGQKKLFNDMIDVYLSQNIDSLYNFTAQSPDIQGFEDELLNSRNEDWIPKIQEMSAEKATFYAVGAGHLGGTNGVIALLRKAGYTLTAVN